jgi:hypothetical protein
LKNNRNSALFHYLGLTLLLAFTLSKPQFAFCTETSDTHQLADVEEEIQRFGSSFKGLLFHPAGDSSDQESWILLDFQVRDSFEVVMKNAKKQRALVVAAVSLDALKSKVEDTNDPKRKDTLLQLGRDLYESVRSHHENLGSSIFAISILNSGAFMYVGLGKFGTSTHILAEAYNLAIDTGAVEEAEELSNNIYLVTKVGIDQLKAEINLELYSHIIYQLTQGNFNFPDQFFLKNSP